jgi:hypothetical protein
VVAAAAAGIRNFDTSRPLFSHCLQVGVRISVNIYIDIFIA